MSWLRQPEPWVVDQLRADHVEALHAFGEWTVFVLMWRAEDFHAGLVERCSTCFTTHGLVADTFQQASDSHCPDCFGSSFDGGFKARIVRPATWDPNTVDHVDHVRGEVRSNAANVQSTADFQLRVGDYVMRSDATRWQMRKPSTNLIHAGFDSVTPQTDGMGFNYGQCDLEEPNSVAYLIPASDVVGATLGSILLAGGAHYPDQPDVRDPTGTHRPPGFATHEIIRGPLFPVGV